MKLASRLGDFLRSLFKVTGIPQATTGSRQPSASSAEMKELAAHTALRTWLRREGASIDNCYVGETPSFTAGYGVFTARRLRCGDEIFSCPLHVAMRATDVFGDEVIGTALREVGEPLLDSRALLMLLLIHSRAQGESSIWSHYIKTLPGQEIVGALPMHWDSERLDVLTGTPLRLQAQYQLEALEQLFNRMPTLIQTRPCPLRLPHTPPPSMSHCSSSHTPSATSHTILVLRPHSHSFCNLGRSCAGAAFTATLNLSS
jgi:hypothetical protein